MQQNIGSATAQAELNRVNQYTPQGSSTYQVTGTNADGTPQYSQTTAYSPQEQQKYDLSNQVAISLDGLANDSVGRVSQIENTPFNYDSMTPLVTQAGQGNPFNLQGGPTPGQGVQTSLNYSGLTAIPGANNYDQNAQDVSNSVYSQAASRLDPQWNQQKSDLTSQLAAQGISVGSDAYNREMTNFNNAKTDAYNQANYSAVQAGQSAEQQQYEQALGTRQQQQNEINTQGAFTNSAQNQAFTQGQNSAELNNQNQNQYFNQSSANAALNNQGRQQQETEAAYLRNLPINDIAALLGTGGGVNDPQFQSVSQVGVAAPDYQGIVQNNYNQAMNQYNQSQAAQAQMLGSIFGAAGTAASGYFSDARLKTDIRLIGELANGIKTYAFKYIGDTVQHFGVMAQNVIGIMPEAVWFHPNGYMVVDYGRVYS